MTELIEHPKRATRLRRLSRLLFTVLVVWAIVLVARRLTPPAPLTLARAAVANGALNDAVERFLQHLARNPEDWGVRNELGLVLAQIDKPQALLEFRKVPPASEAYEDARRQIAVICLATERLEEAKEVLLELVDKQPEDWSLQLLLAETLFRQRQARSALPHAKKSAELNPEHPRSHFLVAELLDDLNRTGEMVAPLEKVLELDPEDYPAHLNLAYAFAETGQFDKSKLAAEWCLAKVPADINARRYLALAARAAGHHDEAQQEIERALALAPNDFACRLLEAELLLFQRQAEQALERLKPLYAEYKDDRRLVALLARAAAGAGRKDEEEDFNQQLQKLKAR